MRKCHDCGETKALKQINVAYCDDDTHSHEKNGYMSSICQSCYVICSCGIGEEDNHSVDDCLQEPDCPNHKLTKDLCENWDNYNYHWNLKKTVEVTV